MKLILINRVKNIFLLVTSSLIFFSYIAFTSPNLIDENHRQRNHHQYGAINHNEAINNVEREEHEVNVRQALERNRELRNLIHDQLIDIHPRAITQLRRINWLNFWVRSKEFSETFRFFLNLVGGAIIGFTGHAENSFYESPRGINLTLNDSFNITTQNNITFNGINSTESNPSYYTNTIQSILGYTIAIYTAVDYYIDMQVRGSLTAQGEREGLIRDRINILQHDLRDQNFTDFEIDREARNYLNTPRKQIERWLEG